MRAGLLVFLALSCAPRAPAQRTFDDDLEHRSARAAAEPVAATSEPRPVAPPGKGLRTGTIARAHLLAVLDGGPAMFLRQFEVTPQLAGDRFVGWQLVQVLDPSGPLHDLDLAPGDVLLAINGKPLARPEQLQTLWDSLRTANEVAAELRRGAGTVELRFTVDPPVASPVAAPVAAPVRPPAR